MRSVTRRVVTTTTGVLAVLTFYAPSFGQPGADDPEAMRKLAATVPQVDIVGVKLGMAPQDVMAALKAANPNFRIDTLNMQLEVPPGGTYQRQPHWVIAHTVGPVRNFFAAPPSYAGEVVAVEFTTPPARAVAARIIREVTFPDREPVTASTLIEALHQKYGATEAVSSDNRTWVYDSAGKVIPRLSDSVARCVPGAPEQGFPMWNNGWGDYSPTGNYLTWSVTSSANPTWEDRGPACEGYTVLQAHNLGDPKALKKSLVITVQSAKLLNQSRVATHNYLQQLASGAANQQRDQAGKRAAPKL